MKGKQGRPPKLTPEVQEKIIQLVRVGNYVSTAARCAGINPETLYRWVRNGTRGETPTIYTAFTEALRHAEAEAEAIAVQEIRKASHEDPRNWMAAMTFLERRFRHRWGRSVI